MSDKRPVIKIGGIELQPARMKSRRMAILLWGAPKIGKTTLAATAPGKKLWISFDADATAPLSACPEEIMELDLSGEPNSVVEKFKDPLRGICNDINKLLGSDDTIESVIVDSLTTFGEKALVQGVSVATTTVKGRHSTLENPGYSGHGNKNTWMRLLTSNMLQITGRHNRHLVLIAHEDKPEKDDQGAVLYTTLMLGSSLVVQVPKDLSEVWHMDVSGSKSKHRIQIRPCRGYKPMGTRMFTTTGEPEFDWTFNPDTWKGEGIAQWYEQWRIKEFSKIPLPK